MFYKNNPYESFFLFVFIFIQQLGKAQMADCKAVLRNDTLVLENSIIKRTFFWNGGALHSIAIYNKALGEEISGISGADKPDLVIPGITEKPQNGSFRIYTVKANNISSAYLAAEVVVQTGSLSIKRIFRIYPNCPAIACDYYLRGRATEWSNILAGNNNFTNIETENAKSTAEGKVMITDKINISGNHWQAKAVEFFDATDYNNNLVEENSRLIYRQENKLRGNLLMLHSLVNKAAFFVLKEAPVSGIQLYYQGFDFSTKWGEVKVAGIGIAPADLSDSNWVKGYSVVIGVDTDTTRIGLLQSLRKYQQLQRIYKEDRDAMIVSNTWGDRNRDSRVNEKFILMELEAASKLGITHLQIDDGWQTGVSSNSAFGGSLANIWRNPHYWDVDSVKFPGGLIKIIEAAKQKGIRISLWFNPSNDSSFRNWENDADVLIAQHNKFGISMWKIDGVQAADKLAEINFRKFLDKVMAASNNEAVFNLDVTAGKRFGYHYMNSYGNLFLENRYTDWGNYYPHFTLRNLWQLSAYIPVQRLQIEFLNKWRNAGKYPAGDLLAPTNYSFDYLFAITMVAQPLAWFEVSGLPAEAFGTAKLLRKYKEASAALHRGQIFPIGAEPNGFGWTGFQSIPDTKIASGYFLLFRENNPQSLQKIRTHLPAGKKFKLKLVAGQGKSFDAMTGTDGSLLFELPKERSFALYEYTNY